MRSPPPARNQLRIRCRYLLWRQDFILSEKCKLKTRTHMGKLAATIQMSPSHLLCGDKISSCRRQVQVENSHPHGKTCSHMGKLVHTIQKTPGSEPVEDQMPVSLVATRFHLVGEVQVENSHPHGKTCTHMGKLAPTLENLHPHGKTRSTFERWHPAATVLES